MPLWKDGTFVEDTWQVVADDAPVPDDAPVVVSLKRWRDERAALAARNAPLGLLIAPGSVWTDIVADLPRFPVIVVTIPKYADGRAFSIARLLRERDGYTGEIRAIGDYIIDQVPFMMRVGIDAFETDDPIAHQGASRRATGRRCRTTSSRPSTRRRRSAGRHAAVDAGSGSTKTD